MGQVNHQLSLPVSLKEAETFDSFIQDSNAQICAHLKQLSTEIAAHNVEHWLTYLFADRGLGKSHILYATCQHAELSDLSSVYLSLNEKNQLSPDILDGLEHYSLICLDDIQQLNGSKEWQIAVFDLINRVKEQANGSLVIAGNQPANMLPIELPDLASRLLWGTNFQLYSLTDEERQRALLVRAEQRGLNMSKDVAKYLVHHWQRDMPALIQSLDKLDEQSLQQQRKLTIPFVKNILGL